MKNFIKGLAVMVMAVTYSAAYNISGKIANWDPDTAGTFKVMASTKTDFSVINASTDIFCASGSTADYVLSVTPLTDSFYVVALLDLNANFQSDANEPGGEYSVFNSTSGPEAITGMDVSDAPDTDFVCTSDAGPYLLRGLAEDGIGNPLEGSIVKYENYSLENDTASTLNYSTPTLVGAKISPSVDPDYIPDYNWQIVIDTTTDPVSVTYDGEYQRIVVSSAGYNVVDSWIWFSTDSVSGKFFKTVHSTSAAALGGNITGTIDYTGAYSGELYLVVGHGDPANWAGDPSLVELNQNCGTVAFPYSYDTGNLPAATDYNIIAWIDSTVDGAYDSADEAGAMYSPSPVTVSDAATTLNIDFNLADPGASPAGVTINVDADGYDFSAGTTAAWGSGADICYSLAFGTPAVLEVFNLDIYDAGTGLGDINDFSTFDNSGTGDGHLVPQVDYYYTFKDEADKKIVIRITAVSATSVTFEYNYDYGYTYYDTGEGIPVSFESVSVTSDGGDAVISPNGDNNDDEFRVNYTLVSPSVTITEQGGANVRIVADTNNNGVADTFKWEQVMWENDAPHFIPETAISSITNVDYYNINGNDWWGYFNSLTQDEKDALKLSYQELDAIQANSDYDFWEWISQDDFYEDAGVYKTNMTAIAKFL